MKVQFQTKSGKSLTGIVVSEGWWIVEGGKSYSVFVESLPHIDFVVPVDDCKVL